MGPAAPLEENATWARAYWGPGMLAYQLTLILARGAAGEGL